jgi:hypothetical protein
MGPDLKLDDWIPRADAAITTAHARRSDASPEELWRAALAVRVRDTGKLGRLVRWRIPGTPADETFGELFTRDPFCPLERGERHLVSGLCGRIWTVQRDYARLAGPEAFRAWTQRGTARVLFAHWVTDEGVLHSEARVAPVDRQAAMRTRAIWALLGPFERLIGAEALTAAVRRAERRAAPASSA